MMGSLLMWWLPGKTDVVATMVKLTPLCKVAENVRDTYFVRANGFDGDGTSELIVGGVPTFNAAFGGIVTKGSLLSLVPIRAVDLAHFPEKVVGIDDTILPTREFGHGSNHWGRGSVGIVREIAEIEITGTGTDCTTVVSAVARAGAATGRTLVETVSVATRAVDTANTAVAVDKTGTNVTHSGNSSTLYRLGLYGNNHKSYLMVSQGVGTSP